MGRELALILCTENSAGCTVEFTLMGLEDAQNMDIKTVTYQREGDGKLGWGLKFGSIPCGI